MTGLGRNLFHAAVGATAGIAGLAVGRCGGGSCTTCLACAVPGVAVVLLGVLHTVSRRERLAPPKPRESEALGFGRMSGSGGP